MFEIRYRDIAGRVGILEVNGKKVETPFIFPVINPNRIIIPIEEIKNDFKIKTIIVNAYILYKNENLREKVLKKGIHKFLNFNGIIETDSGSYQMLHYKKEIEVNNEEIVKFQINIKSDIINVLDIPTDIDADYNTAKNDLQKTIDRIKEGLDIKRKLNFSGLINGAIQGGVYMDLRRESAINVSKMDIDIYAIGTIVPYLINYNFKDLFELIMEARILLPMNKPVHLFGVGHPLIIPLSVALGCDIFDSASYALYAYDKRIITPFGTLRLNRLKNITIETPKKIYYLDELYEMEKEEMIKVIAEHNLYTLIKEIEIVKDAIKNQYLWDLVFIKAHSHYEVYKATKFVLEKYYEWLKHLDPIRKKTGIKYFGDLLELRTDIKRAMERLKERVDIKDVEDIYEYVYPFKDLKNIK